MRKPKVVQAVLTLRKSIVVKSQVPIRVLLQEERTEPERSPWEEFHLRHTLSLSQHLLLLALHGHRNERSNLTSLLRNEFFFFLEGGVSNRRTHGFKKCSWHSRAHTLLITCCEFGSFWKLDFSVLGDQTSHSNHTFSLPFPSLSILLLNGCRLL